MDEPQADWDRSGRRWGFMNGGTFIPLPEIPLRQAGYDLPPFDVTLPSGQIRHVIVEP